MIEVIKFISLAVVLIYAPATIARACRNLSVPSGNFIIVGIASAVFVYLQWLK